MAHTIDLDVFFSLPSTKHMFSDKQGRYCAAGKLLKACGFSEASFYGSFAILKALFPNNIDDVTKIFRLNDNDKFEEADRYILNLAMNTPGFKIKTSSQELIKEFSQIREEKVFLQV